MIKNVVHSYTTLWQDDLSRSLLNLSWKKSCGLTGIQTKPLSNNFLHSAAYFLGFYRHSLVHGLFTYLTIQVIYFLHKEYRKSHVPWNDNLCQEAQRDHQQRIPRSVASHLHSRDKHEWRLSLPLLPKRKRKEILFKQISHQSHNVCLCSYKVVQNTHV